MRSSRIVGTTAALVILGLLALVVLRVTSSATPTGAPAHLTVGPGPLKTATGTLTYTDTNGLSVSATSAFDFTNSRADVTVNASLSIASVNVEVRIDGTTAYVSDQAFSTLTGAPWVTLSIPRAPASIARIGAFLRDPSVVAPHARREIILIKKNVTTTILDYGTVHVPSTAGLPVHLPGSGHLIVTYSTGAQGQLLSVTVHLKGVADDVHATFTVTGYDVPVSVSVPTPSQTVPLTPSRAKDIFGTNAPAVLHALQRIGASIG